MQLSANIRPVSARGTLDIELEDGRTATLEIDMDLSSPQAAWGVDHEYAEGGIYTVGLTRLLASTYSVRIPTNIRREDEGASFILRIPAE